MKKYLFLLLILSSTFSLLAQLPASVSKPFTIGEIHQLQSNVLGETRTLNIYLPADYAMQDTQRYNVIYLLDGGAEEDFIHIAGLVQFSTFPWVERLRPTLVVGIANIDRQLNFTAESNKESDKKLMPNNGGSKAFIQFLQTELQPFIDSAYRTTKVKMLIGQSLGGLLAVEILLKNPRLFSDYVIVSPSLWWNGGSLLNKPTPPLSGNEPLPNVYLAVGKEGLGLGVPPRNMEDDVRALAKKLQPVLKTQFKFEYLPAEDHGTILHEAVSRAFRWGSNLVNEEL